MYLLLLKQNRKSPKSPSQNSKAGKKPREWDLCGTSKDAASLERTKASDGPVAAPDYAPDRSVIATNY